MKMTISVIIAMVAVTEAYAVQRRCPTSGRKDYFQCMDGTFCRTDNRENDCCKYKGGRAACPDGSVMCNDKSCGGGGSYCCEKNVWGGKATCSYHGGVKYEWNHVTIVHGNAQAHSTANGCPSTNGVVTFATITHPAPKSSDSHGAPNLGDELAAPTLGSNYNGYTCTNFWDCSFNHCPVGAGGQCINGACFCDTKPNTCNSHWDCSNQCPLGVGGRCVSSECVCNGAIPHRGQCVYKSDCGEMMCPFGERVSCQWGRCTCEPEAPPAECYTDSECYYAIGCDGPGFCHHGQCRCNDVMVAKGLQHGRHGNVVGGAPNLGIEADNPTLGAPECRGDSDCPRLPCIPPRPVQGCVNGECTCKIVPGGGR